MNRFTNYCVLDLETTGLDPFTCDIIEIAMIRVREGEIVDRFESLVYTPLEISEHVTYLTGLSQEEIKEAPDFITLLPTIKDFLGADPIVGHNIGFDIQFLLQKGLPLDENPAWDTYILSNIVYPQLPSHSLETNTKYFGISHEDSHRAMADVLASHELWNILIHTARKLHPEQEEALQHLEKRSSWGMLPLFLQEHELPKRTLEVPAMKIFEPLKLPEVDLDSFQSPKLLYSDGYDPVETALRLKTSKKTLYIAGYSHTQEKLHQVFPEALRMFPVRSYLSLEKLAALKEKDVLSDAETSLIVKTILHPSYRSQEDFRLSHPERELWKDLCETEEDHPTFQEVHQESRIYLKLITSHHLALQDPELIQSVDQVVILEPHLLEENATHHFGKGMYPDEWKEGDYLFETLERLASQLVPASVYPEHLLLTPLVTESNEFIRLKTFVQQQYEKATDEKTKSFLKYFLAFFSSSDPSWIRWITLDPKKGVSLHLAPLSVKSLLSKHFFQQKPCYVISELSKSFSFLPEMSLGDLSRELPFIPVLPDLDLITGTKKEGDHPAIISYLADQLVKYDGNTGVIFSSKGNLKRYFFDLVKVLPKDFLLLGEDITGGAGKTRDRYFTGHQKNKILFMTYRNLRNFPREFFQFDQIFLQSIPFDPPGHPIFQRRSEQYENPFEEFTMPKVKQNLAEIFSTLERDGQRRVIFLDRRLQQNSYGKSILPFSE